MLTAIAVYALLVAAGPLESPEYRVEQEDIYEVTGQPAALAALRQTLDNDWDGGKFLSTSGDGTSALYWAYSWRTAPQARVFIFSTLNQNLAFDAKSYREVEFFPKERSQLDQITGDCGGSTSSIFILPDRSIHLNAGAGPKLHGCVTAALKRAGLELSIPDVADHASGSSAR